jgi:hypothetical protein
MRSRTVLFAGILLTLTATRPQAHAARANDVAAKKLKREIDWSKRTGSAGMKLGRVWNDKDAAEVRQRLIDAGISQLNFQKPAGKVQLVEVLGKRLAEPLLARTRKVLRINKRMTSGDEIPLHHAFIATEAFAKEHYAKTLAFEVNHHHPSNSATFTQTEIGAGTAMPKFPAGLATGKAGAFAGSEHHWVVESAIHAPRLSTIWYFKGKQQK